MEPRSPIPWLHIVDVVADAAADRRCSKLGILGTRALMEGAVYPEVLSKRGLSMAIPDAAHRERINAAFEFGGQELQTRTVSAFTGVPIAFSIVTNFDGLIGMVDDLGGVDVDMPQAMNDRFSGAVFPQGRVHMNGGQALAFSRNRHLGDGDLTRTYDQGVLILSALAKLRAQPGGAAGVVRSLEVLLRRCQAEGVSPRDLYRLGRLALSVDPANVRNVVMPARLGQVGPASVVFAAPGADSLFADFRDDAILQTH